MNMPKPPSLFGVEYTAKEIKMAKNKKTRQWTELNEYEIPYICKGSRTFRARSMECAIDDCKDWIKRTDFFERNFGISQEILEDEITYAGECQFDNPAFRDYLLKGYEGDGWGDSIPLIAMARDYFKSRKKPVPADFPTITNVGGVFRVG